MEDVTQTTTDETAAGTENGAEIIRNSGQERMGGTDVRVPMTTSMLRKIGTIDVDLLVVAVAAAWTGFETRNEETERGIETGLEDLVPNILSTGGQVHQPESGMNVKALPVLVRKLLGDSKRTCTLTDGIAPRMAITGMAAQTSWRGKCILRYCRCLCLTGA